MNQEFDYEGAISAMPPAIASSEDAQATARNLINDCDEVAKEVNAPAMTRVAESIKQATEAIISMMKDINGEEGENALDGTMYGALGTAKRQLEKLS